MKQYHFHIFDGQAYTPDYDGSMLPDLAAVVAEAEARVRTVMSTRPDIADWSKWKVDVRGQDDITLFHYPFEDLTRNAV
jgi:hypothetical protein